MSFKDQMSKIPFDASEAKYVPSGVVMLDSVLSKGQGIPRGTFIEIASDSGIGKCVSPKEVICINDQFQSIGGYSESCSSLDLRKQFIYSTEATEYDVVSSFQEATHLHRVQSDTVAAISDIYGGFLECTPGS